MASLSRGGDEKSSGGDGPMSCILHCGSELIREGQQSCPNKLEGQARDPLCESIRYQKLHAQPISRSRRCASSISMNTRTLRVRRRWAR